MPFTGCCETAKRKPETVRASGGATFVMKVLGSGDHGIPTTSGGLGFLKKGGEKSCQQRRRR
jgi:hypothetical protein